MNDSRDRAGRAHHNLFTVTAPTFDLQAHSTCSDGSLTPAEVVAWAAAAGVELLALTDHDTVGGVEEAAEAAIEHRIRLSPAVELSSVDQRERDLHVCGYEIDVHSHALAEALADWRADRVRRALKMADAIEALGVPLDRTILTERESNGRSLGRPHVAAAVLAHPDNAGRFPGGTDEVFAAFLAPGAPTYLPRTRPSPTEAVDAIRAAGGVAVWAHPFWDIQARAEVEETARQHGFDGIECFYVGHDEEQTRFAYELATRLGLLATGSSDFHGPGERLFGAFRAFELYGLEPRLGRIGAG